MSDSIEPRRSSLALLDGFLVVAGVIGAVLVLLWVIGAVVGLILLAFKIAVIVVAGALVVRVVHHFSRR